MTDVVMWSRRLWSEFAIGLGASAIEQLSTGGSEKMKDRQENRLSKHTSVASVAPAKSHASDFDAANGESSANWLDVAEFMRELEALRLRMITVRLRGAEDMADAPLRLSSELSVASDAPPFPVVDDGWAIRRVQDAVTDAVRLLSYGANSFEQREAASLRCEEPMHHHSLTLFQRARD